MSASPSLHPFLVNEEPEDTQDEDPQNMMFRAGALAGLSWRLPNGHEDRKLLQRAARSLAHAALKLGTWNT